MHLAIFILYCFLHFDFRESLVRLGILNLWRNVSHWTNNTSDGVVNSLFNCNALL